jgi:hypothetical protein
MNMQILAKKNEIAQAKEEGELNIKNKDLDLKKTAEDNVVALNDKHSTTDERIRMLELEVNTLLEHSKLAQSDKMGMMEHHRELKKIDVDKVKASKMGGMGGKNKDYVKTNR